MLFGGRVQIDSRRCNSSDAGTNHEDGRAVKVTVDQPLDEDFRHESDMDRVDVKDILDHLVFLIPYEVDLHHTSTQYQKAHVNVPGLLFDGTVILNLRKLA